MKLLLTSISNRRSTLSGPSSELLALYIQRSTRYVPCSARNFPSEAALSEFIDEVTSRTRPFLILADSAGKQLSSPEIAAVITRAFDTGSQTLILAVGPPDGWSPASLARADLVLAFGRITLPHELALVVASEQLYRALTIRAGHPYHSGH